jgi:hypothetical protein
MVKLYIENKLIELDQDVQFAITKTFEDITNPTSIINDWSKTVEIPFTQHNNNVFGHIYNPDRLTLHGSETTPIIGLYFDPLKKLSFRLEWDNSILMSGYAKMTSINKTNGTGKYNITLNGELGKVFQEMKKITFDVNKYSGEDKEKYFIDGSKYVDFVMNVDAFINSDQTNPGFWQKGNEYFEFPVKNRCINFCPNNGFTKNFDYKIYETIDPNTSNHITRKFTEDLDENDFAATTGANPDDVIPKGLRPREYGEYRTYLQHPFIYLHQLFYIFKEKFESISDYKINLDQFWFNEFNPYWTKLIFMLKSLSIDKGDSMTTTNYYATDFINNNNVVWQGKVYHGNVYDWETNPEFPQITTPITTNLDQTIKLIENDSNESLNIVDWETNPPLFKLDYLLSINSTYDLNLIFSQRYKPTQNGKRTYLRKHPASINDIDQGINLTLQFDFYKFISGTKTHIGSKTKDYFVCSSYNKNPDTTKQIIYVGQSVDLNQLIINGTEIPGNWQKLLIQVPISETMNFNNSSIDPDVYVSINFNAAWQNTSSPIIPDFIRSFDWEFAGYDLNKILDIYLLPDNSKYLQINVLKQSANSGARYILNDFWENKSEVFNEILNYCKIFRINISVDEFTKTINFIQNKDFFKNFTIEDWTKKLDNSKSIEIVPVTFENKFVLFNYDKDESDINKKYQNETGVNYGEYKLTTDYNFNTETKSLFNGVKTSINYTPYLISWKNLIDNNEIIYLFPNDIFVYDYDEKELELFGKYFFYNGLVNFDNNEVLQLGNVVVSDDTDYQILNQLSCFTGTSDLSKIAFTTKYPLCSVSDGDNCCLFNIPNKNYTSNSSLFTQKQSIFVNFWENYLNERYNINNKKVTCYLDITPFDFINFNYNKFIKIEKQLFFVNKIYDYDFTNNTSTKVDLITIQDIDGYVKNNFDLNFFKMYSVNGEPWDEGFDYIPLEPDEEITMFISSSTPVTWFNDYVENGSLCSLYGLSINGVQINEENGSGNIEAGIKVPVKFKNSVTDKISGFGKITFVSETGFRTKIDINLIKYGIRVKNNGAIIVDNDTIEFGSSTGSSSLYLKVNSYQPVNISCDVLSGTAIDAFINGVNIEDVQHGVDTFKTINAGKDQPLNITTDTGGSDFKIKITLTNTNGDSRQFFVKHSW